MIMLNLTEELFLGKGVHRAAYIHPKDKTKCIKILFHEPDAEWEREKRYRRSRERRHLQSKLLTAYYGEVQTNKGIGYVFERVADFDGKPSMDFREFLERQKQQENQANARLLLQRVLMQLKQDFFSEKVIVSNMHYGNFLIQRYDAEFAKFQVRIIDNIDSPAKIPLAFYVDCIALKRCKKYWHQYLLDISKDYPELLTETMLQELLH